MIILIYSVRDMMPKPINNDNIISIVNKYNSDVIMNSITSDIIYRRLGTYPRVRSILLYNHLPLQPRTWIIENSAIVSWYEMGNNNGSNNNI